MWGVSTSVLRRGKCLWPCNPHPSFKAITSISLTDYRAQVLGYRVTGVGSCVGHGYPFNVAWEVMEAF